MALNEISGDLGESSRLFDFTTGNDAGSVHLAQHDAKVVCNQALAFARG
ncbi:MAG: hypothetical protein ABIK28_01140 [Planctomycetota bacterium]